MNLESLDKLGISVSAFVSGAVSYGLGMILSSPGVIHIIGIIGVGISSGILTSKLVEDWRDR